MGKRNSKSLVLRDNSTTIKPYHNDSESNTESNSNRTVTRVDTSTLSSTDSSLSKENLLELLLELIKNTKIKSTSNKHQIEMHTLVHVIIVKNRTFLNTATSASYATTTICVARVLKSEK